MRFAFLLCCFLIVVFFGGQRYLHPQLSYNSISDRLSHPFDTRVRYRIGQVDPRFGLDEKSLIELSQQATDIWLLGTQQQYFLYDPNAKLSINLIYDQRQSESFIRQQHIQQIEQHQIKALQLQQNLNLVNQQLAQQYQSLQLAQQQYDQQLAHYNQRVQQYNQNPNLYNANHVAQLKSEKLQIQQKLSELKQSINHYNQSVQNSNQRVSEFRSLQQQSLSLVEQFNQKFQPRLFDKGEFNGKTINIYEFQSKADLKMTLAHEFGHVLGLDHHDDPQALMYPVLEKQPFENFHLQPADLALLQQSRQKF